MWTVGKIKECIVQQIEENIHLEYKAADALGKSEGKKNELAKDVSALANSDGGTIIYGVREFTGEKKYLPEKIDPVSRNDFSKEWLEQVINHNISPRIHGITVTAVTVDETKPNEVIYV